MKLSRMLTIVAALVASWWAGATPAVVGSTAASEMLTGAPVENGWQVSGPESSLMRALRPAPAFDSNSVQFEGVGIVSMFQGSYHQPPEAWVPYIPEPNLVAIKIKSTKGVYEAAVSIEPLPTPCYRSDWGSALRTGNDFMANAIIEAWTGYCILILGALSHTYQLGALAPGQYRFIFKARSNPVKEVVFTVPEGDVNQDSVVDHLDLRLVAAVLGVRQGDPGYSQELDITGDGVINIHDLAMVGRNLGK